MAKCSSNKFDSSLYAKLFDETCAQQLQINGEICGVDTANKLLGALIAPLKIEAMYISFLSLVYVLMMLQLGGIVVPAGSHLATFFWFLNAALLCVQMFVPLLYVMLIVGAFTRARMDLHECVRPMDDNLGLIEVVAFTTFVFQPVVLSQIILITVYFSAFIESVKVFCGSYKIDPRFGIKWCICGGPYVRIPDLDTENMSIDLTMMGSFLLRFLIPLVFVFLALWVISLSWVFGLVFFLPVCLVAFCLHLVTMKAMCSGYSWLEKKRVQSKLKGVKKEVLNTLWWAPHDFLATWGKKSGEHTPFTFILMIAYAPLVLSPLIVFGALMAVHVYAGHSPEDNMELVRLVYEFTYESLTDLASMVRSLRLLGVFGVNLAQIGPAVLAVIEALVSLQDSTVETYLVATKGCALINFFLVVVKSILSALVQLLDAWMAFAKPVPFSVIAAANRPEKWVEAVKLTIPAKKNPAGASLDGIEA